MPFAGIRVVLLSGMKKPVEPASLAEPATRNIATIATLEREALHERSALDRFTDAITAATGSPAFVVLHSVWFLVWIAVNVTGYAPFDPYPFSLLTLIVSLEAIFLTGIVLMTQNRMARQADKRARLDLQINLLAEQELTAMLQMLHALCLKAGVEITIHDTRVEQLLEETDIHEIAVALDREQTDRKTT
jgi:uncharacterized membrane protein